MESPRSTDEKINKYGTLAFYIFLITLTHVIAFYAIYAAYNWEIGKNDFTNWLIAGGTISSSFGLIWFSYLTYKNQQNIEFYSLFKVLLDEHNSLLKEIMGSNKDSLFSLNENIIDLFRISKKFFLKHEQNIEIDFLQKLNQIIDFKYEFKPYLITLFRLLKLISTSTKINCYEKREYYGLVRGLTTPDIQFLILFNSICFQDDKKQPNYQNLLIEEKFFEHLPITTNWLKAIYLHRFSRTNIHRYWEYNFLADKFIPLLKQNITSGKFIDLQAFGQSIYLEKNSV